MSTSDPTAVTSPAISWPSTNGIGGLSGTPSRRCRSVWQTPAARTRTSAWPGPGTGLGTDRTLNGSPRRTNTAANIDSGELCSLVRSQARSVASPVEHGSVASANALCSLVRSQARSLIAFSRPPHVQVPRRVEHVHLVLDAAQVQKLHVVTAGVVGARRLVLHHRGVGLRHP